MRFAAPLAACALAVPALAPASALADIVACRTDWEMHLGEGVVGWGYDMGTHGNITEYDYSTLPDPAGAGWVPAPDPVEIDYDLGGNSTICGVVDCRYGGDFTYFKTLVYLPPSLVFTDVQVSVGVVDDGVRMTVYSPSNPNGVTDPGGYAFLGGGSSSNLLPYMSSDPYSTIVLTHVDDCCSQSYILDVSIEVTVGGRPETIYTSCDIEDTDGDGVPPAGGDCDDDDAAIHPGATEVPDGVDDDCDGVIDEGTAAYDDDDDGWTELDGDCDDDAPFTSPSAEEDCDQWDVDADCDGCPGGTDPDCGGTCGDPGDDDSSPGDDDDSSPGDDDDTTDAGFEQPTTAPPLAGDGCDCTQTISFAPVSLLWGLGAVVPGRRRRRARR